MPVEVFEDEDSGVFASLMPFHSPLICRGDSGDEGDLCESANDCCSVRTTERATSANGESAFRLCVEHCQMLST